MISRTFRSIHKTGPAGQSISAITIATNIADYNLYNNLIALGWNGIDAVTSTVTINAGVYVYSTNTTNAGFATGNLPAGSAVTIINNGYIMGKGGVGGSASVGGNAGDAVSMLCNVSINNTAGYIGGGGGGGGGYGGGGAGGGNSGTGTTGSPLTAQGGSPGSAGQDGPQPEATPGSTLYYCGGAGGRIISGTGGAAVSVNYPKNSVWRIRGGYGGGSGGSGAVYGNASDKIYGTVTSGAGGTASAVGGNGSGTAMAGSGGGGGGWGAAGGNAMVQSTIMQAGGLGGKAVALNGKTLIWIGGFQATRTFGAVS